MTKSRGKMKGSEAREHDKVEDKVLKLLDVRELDIRVGI